jgi:hypothetical protein
MLSRLPTIALLMLLAGVCLGVFAARAARSFGPELPAPGSGNPAALERKVDVYQRHYQLDPHHTDQVRRALLDYDRAVREKYLAIRQDPAHADEFRRLQEQVRDRIAGILADAGADLGED